MASVLNMKISGTGPVPTPAIRRRDARSRTSGSFAGEFSADAAVRESAAPMETAPASTLLSVQEVADPLAGRRQAVRRGEDLLDRLDDLRHGLLIGSFPEGKLNELVALARRQRAVVSDPRLHEVLDDIETRAAVELAKMGK